MATEAAVQAHDIYIESTQLISLEQNQRAFKRLRLALLTVMTISLYHVNG